MTLDTAKAAVDYFVNNLRVGKEKGFYSKDKITNINFFGGEPTILWDEIIVPLVNYAKEKYPKEVKFGMTTNGTLLNKERIDFLFEHKIAPLLSIDGAKYTQDYNRPCNASSQSSFDLIYSNIPYLLEKFPNTTFRSTILEDTVSHTFENYLFATFSGFKNIFMIPNARNSWSKKNIEILKNELEKIYWYMANCFCNNKEPISFKPINESFKYVLEHDLKVYKKDTKDISTLVRNYNRCGLGTTTGSIGYDGKIYGCQEQNSKDEKNIFLIGDIFSGGIDIEKHKTLLYEYSHYQSRSCENKELCKICKLSNICNGAWCCPSTCWDLYGEFFQNSEILCLWRSWMFDNAIILLKYFKENNNELFKNYLNKKCEYEKYFKIKKEG